MAIDPNSIQWDDAPQIDPAGIVWDDPFADLNREFSQVAPAGSQRDPFAELNKEFMTPSVPAQPQQQTAMHSQSYSTEPVQAPQIPISPTVQPAPHMAGRFGGTMPLLPENAGKELMQDAGNLLAGALRGAGSIGATIVAPYDIVQDLRAGKGLSLESNRQRRADMDLAFQELGAQPDSMAYKGGKLGTEIAGTAGAGGMLAKGAAMLPGAAKIAPLIESIRSGGFRAGGMQGLEGLATRAVGGAITGGASAGLVNPEDAGIGAIVGGVIPGSTAVVGGSTRGLGRALRGGEVKPAVSALAQKAQDLGINIPGDRIVNSKPLNALAAITDCP